MKGHSIAYRHFSFVEYFHVYIFDVQGAGQFVIFFRIGEIVEQLIQLAELLFAHVVSADAHLDRIVTTFVQISSRNTGHARTNHKSQVKGLLLQEVFFQDVGHTQTKDT